jgi:hypothetical protein
MAHEIALPACFYLRGDGGFMRGQTIHINGGAAYY